LTEELPHAPEAEAAVLCCLIENPSKFWPRASEAGIAVEFFHLVETAALWKITAGLLRDGKSIDPATVRDTIKDKRPAGLSLSTFSRLLGTEFEHAAWDGYIDALRDRLARRLSISAGFSVAAENMSGEDAISALKDAARKAASALSGTSAVADAKSSVKAFLASLTDRYENGEMPGLASGMPAIDQKTGGLRPGELWVIGAPTSWGKSVFMLQATGNAIRDGKTVVVFSLEMGKEEIIARIVSSQWSISMGELMNPRTTKNRTPAKITDAANTIGESGLMICDSADQSVDSIAAHCDRISDSRKIDLVVVDYLQLVSTPRIKGQNREQEVASISRGLKQLAKRMGCPVITATQLNEQGKSRESRAVEHDADCVIFFSAAPEVGGKQDMTFWKVRNGSRGAAMSATLNGEMQRFTFS